MPISRQNNVLKTEDANPLSNRRAYQEQYEEEEARRERIHGGTIYETHYTDEIQQPRRPLGIAREGRERKEETIEAEEK